MKQAAPRSGEWVIVCDGRKVLILENAGDDKLINLRSKEVHEHADPSTRALGTDTPGRAHPSVGTARSAVKAEIGKDYVKMPIHDIEKIFAG